jgi:hypothetical protein
MPSPESPRTSIIRLEGEFDLPAARMLEHSLRGVAPGNRVRIDFSRVRRLHDFGIATLAKALQAVAADAVTLQGLSTHHVRLLRYFGVDAAVFRREADEEAER